MFFDEDHPVVGAGGCTVGGNPDFPVTVSVEFEGGCPGFQNFPVTCGVQVLGEYEVNLRACCRCTFSHVDDVYRDYAGWDRRC